MRRAGLRLFTLGAVVAAWPSPAGAQVTRTEVIDRAKAYTFYPWRASAANLTASCQSSYESAYVVGDFMGVAYDWGGFDSLFQYSQKLRNGYGAGTPAGGDVLSCTTGVDCSGFISRAWKTTSKYGTSTLHQISSVIATNQLLPGDIFNDAGNHVVMFSHLLASGAPYFYEAYPPQTRVNAHGSWSWVNGYVPRRYQSITGTSAANPVGTLNNPIAIGALPFTDSRDTSTAPSSVLDGCGAAPTANESGPEYVYRITVTSPGQLTVAVSDDAGTDVDVHLASSWNTTDCIARHDTSFTQAVDCGTYYIVVDTYGGTANAGTFDLMVSHAPSGQACGGGPPGYDPQGQLGDACANPNNPDLPPCNATLGASVCLYTSTQSFCSATCATDADCAAMPGGGCCADIGSSEYYCQAANLCPAPPDDPDPTGEDDGSGSGDSSEDPSDPGTPGEGDGAGGCTTSGGQGTLLVALLACIGLRRRRRVLPG